LWKQNRKSGFLLERDAPEEAGKRRGSSSFLKKEPKNFHLLGAPLIGPFEPTAWQKEQKFFVSFFKKEMLPFLPWCVSLYAG
jgi:hypothetical protein